MQNFTLGKRGLPMLLFALTLLTTSFSSLAQNCPTVADTTQDFCYLARVSDLEATANGDTVRWYRTATSTTPIPEDELLQDGSYYAGNASGNCTSRVLVSVSVDDAGAPEPQFGNIFAPCVYGTTSTDVKTVQDLIANIDGFQVEIYEEQFTGNPLPPSTPLEIGENYFAGQRNETTGCPTSRVAVRYDPVFAPAPTAEPVQTFCEGATVADLEAQGTSENTQGFRWYSTATSQPPLASSTELIDGETYYVSQIVNRDDRNEPPCESRDRFEVIVDIQQPADLGTPKTGIVCESDVQETFPSFDAIRNYYLSLLPEGTPTDGTFDPTPEEIAQMYQNDADGLGDFLTTYTVGVDGCESSVELTITVIAEEEANAGTIEDIVVECGNDEVIILDDSLLSEDATTGGTFTGEGVNAEGNFDPAIGPGTYTITYSVDDSADCVIDGTSDSTTFNITVEGSELGEPIVMEMCIIEAQALLASPADAEAFFNNILAENGITDFSGNFNPSEDIVGSAIFAYINSNPTAPQTFETTYSISNSCGDDSVSISLTINNTTAPEAGEINPAPVCASATPFDLNSLLGDNNDQGGTFSENGELIEGGLFDVSQTGQYTITYTVTESAENCTEGEPDSTIFTLTVNEGIVAESPAPAIVCESDVQTLFPSNDEVRKFYVAIAQQAGFPTNGTFDPNVAALIQAYQNDQDGLGDFTTTYTFGEGDCQTSVELTVRIVPAEDANAGSIEDVTVDCDNEESIVLASLPNEGGITGGTFSGEGVTNGSFDPSVGPGTYTITYSVDDSAVCVTPGTSAETTFTITVQGTEEPNAGEINPAPVCASATPFNLNSLLGDNNDQGGTFSNEDGVIEDGLFDVSETGTYNITYTVTASDENCTEGEPDSTIFTLTVNEGTVAESPENAIVCETDVQELFPSNDEIRKFYVAIAQQAGFPTNGTLNPNAAQLAQMYQNDADGLGEFTTTYTFGEGDCQTSVELTVEIVPATDANAGSIEDVTVDCNNEESIVLASLPNDGGNTGGTFSGEGVTNGSFDPSVGPGTYTITYSVDDSADCVNPGTSAETTFTITVQSSFDLGEPIALEMCITEVQAMVANPQLAIDLFNNVIAERTNGDLSGEFTPSIQTLAGQIVTYLGNPTPSQTFETTYSVSTDCGDDSVLISLTINDTTAPEAGEINPAPVCASTTPFDLNSLLGDNNDQGGTFSNEDGEIEDGLFDVSETGTYNITYTVTASDENCTEGEPDSTTFILTVNEGIVAESPENAIVCETDVQETFPSNDEIRKFYVAIAQQAGFPTNGTLNPTAAQLAQMYQNDADGLGEFTTTYTFGEGDCQTSVELTVEIVPATDANAGSIEDVTVDCNNEESIVLASLLNDGGNTGGTFSGEGVTNGSFDPSVGPGTYTITYSVDDTADCVTPGTSAETTFTITVQSSFDLGEPIALEMCITEVQAMVANPQLAIDLFNDAIAERTNGDLSGEFTPSIQTLAGQIVTYLGNPTPSQTFETTYSVSTDCGDDSVLVSLTINDVTEATTGDIADFQVCGGDSPINLFDRLTDANTMGGTFSTEDGEIVNGLFDVSQMGDYTVTYTVSEDQVEACVEGTASTEFTITVTDGITLENPEAVTICESDVETTFPSIDEIRKFYVALIPAGVPTNGTFNPTAAQIAQIYQNDEDGLGNFTTTYTVTSDDCVTTVELTASIVAEEEATLEPIANSNVCLSEDGFDLSALVSGNTPGGTFTSGNGTITGNNLDVSEDGTFNITYTVADSDPSTCLTGSASETFTITVGGNANAGADNSVEVCNADVRDLNTAAVRNLYLGLLEEGVTTDGTFTPTINEIIAQYNSVSNFGDFTTTYTVGNGDCQDSAVLTVTVIEANDAGDDVTIALCTTGEAVDLFDYLSPLATTNGTFEGFEDGVFDPADAELGDTVITYEVPEDDSVCSTGNFTATFTITVSEPVAANAGDDETIEYCSELNEEIALSSLLTEGAIAGGTFSAPFEDGTFNPSVSGEGEYVITYTLDGVACTTGTDSSTITVTVVGATEAPVADAEQTFCFVDEPTVGDIVVDGEGVVIYEDAELTTPADATDPLITGASYFASFSESAACASGVTMITVTIQDSDAPTLVIDGDEFCRSDNPTVQELIENLNGAGIQIYTAVTGGTALATTTLLEDGVTYFASGTDTEGACESSERLAVQVEVDFCGIPEGFSPNGDNINDFFVIPDIATDYPNYELEVYNRWGSLVFEGNAGTGDWDGTSNQSATLGDGVLPTGFYFYILNYNDGQTEPVQGKVYLSR